MDFMTGEKATGTLVVLQDRQWVGDPRLGGFNVSVNGRRVGKAPVQGRLVVPVSPGPNTVRIRQWWFRSPPVTLDIASDATVRLRGDIPRSMGFSARMFKFLISPGSALVLEVFE
jgi:hypothetical protein